MKDRQLTVCHTSQVKEPKIQYHLDILEKVFEDYRAQETGEHLQQQETQAFSAAGHIAC